MQQALARDVRQALVIGISLTVNSNMKKALDMGMVWAVLSDIVKH